MWAPWNARTRGRSSAAALAALLLGAFGGTVGAAPAGECYRYTVHGIAPGMRSKQVEKETGVRASATELVPGPFGPASVVTYVVRSGEKIVVQYDRALDKSPEPVVVDVLSRAGGPTTDLAAFLRGLLAAYGEPASGREHLDRGLRTGPAVWGSDDCDQEVTAFRKSAEWWEPSEGELYVEVRSRRNAEVVARWKRSSEAAVVPVVTAAGPGAAAPADGGEPRSEPSTPEGGETAAAPPPPPALELTLSTEPLPESPAPSEVTTPPVRIPDACPPPKYPPAAQRLRIGARVQVRVRVLADGTVSDVVVLDASRPGMGFEQAAQDAVRHWRFVAATKDGKPVNAFTEFWIEFL